MDNEITLMSDGGSQPAWAHPDREFVVKLFNEWLDEDLERWERDQQIAARRQEFGVVG